MVFMQNSSQWCLRNFQLLRTTVNWYWWRFTHTFCHSINILGCMHWFWLFTLWFIDEVASFLHSFPKITYIRTWRCFSFSKIRTQFPHTFCNITMIFKVMSQYFPAGFLCPEYDNFACLYFSQDQNELHLKRWFFFLPKLVSSVSRSQAHLAQRCSSVYTTIFVRRKD